MLRMMGSDIHEIIKQIDNCLLPKLFKTDEESEVHPEYEFRLKNLDHNFHSLLNFLGKINLREETVVIGSLKILYKELCCDGPWKSELSKECANKLNTSFNLLCGISLEKVFSSDTFDSQELFDTCMKILHEKISGENFKYYPSLVEVYCLFVEYAKEYGLTVDPAKVLPISLYLIDDYINSNKSKGLKCLCAILKCLKSRAFSEGNYYEVIYRSLKSKVYDKDIEVTKFVLECLLRLFKTLPKDIKIIKTEDILSVILEQLYIESNLYRKTLLLNFLKNIIEMHGANCVKRKKIKQIFCDNIDICCNDAVADILLSDLLECLEMWVRHCWCAWKLSTDHKLLSLLIKLLYVTQEEHWILKITYLIITLINLCSNEEQKQITENLKATQFTNLKFIESLNTTNREIGKQIEIVY